MKLKRIKIENYKSYALKTTVDFSKLNIITGVNSSGKSSLIETLLILGQLDSHDILNGNLKKLGSYNNLRNNQLSDELSSTIRIEYFFDDSENSRKKLEIEEKYNSDDLEKVDVAFLSAERVGILNSYNKNRDLNYFSPKGEELVSLLYELKGNKNFLENNRSLFVKGNKIREVFENLPIYESNPLQ